MNTARLTAAIRRHPNFHQDDFAALAAKGYSVAEIRAIWDRDTQRNGGVPPGGNSRQDLKLPRPAGFGGNAYLSDPSKPLPRRATLLVDQRRDFANAAIASRLAKKG